MKKSLRPFLYVFIFLFAIYCVGALLLTTSYLNGFVGTIGVVRLELFENDYIEVGNDPLLVLVRRDSEFIKGYITRSGIRYRVAGWSPFTRRYNVLRIEPD